MNVGDQGWSGCAVGVAIVGGALLTVCVGVILLAVVVLR